VSFFTEAGPGNFEHLKQQKPVSMQKIAIIGHASVGQALAERMTLMSSDIQPFVIGLDEGFVIHEPTPKVVDDYSDFRDVGSFSHSFEGVYKPTAEEIAWLKKLSAQAEAREQGLLCSASYWYSSQKEAARRAQQPRHQSQFTKAQSSAKSRKAARRRAKLGRKATR
jgi:hypothetical protein